MPFAATLLVARVAIGYRCSPTADQGAEVQSRLAASTGVPPEVVAQPMLPSTSKATQALLRVATLFQACHPPSPSHTWAARERNHSSRSSETP